MPCNDAAFQGEARERNRDFARGWSDRQKSFIGGIPFPEETKIAKGTVLVRIGHSRDGRDRPIAAWRNLTSPWWMSSSTFADIAGRGEDAGTPMSQMLRMKLALSYNFGVCDTLFWAVTRAPLRAWFGRGRPVPQDQDMDEAPDGLPQVWYGGWEVGQYYIPGLRDFAADRPTPCALETLAVLPAIPITAWTTIRDGGFGVQPFPWP